MEYLRWGWICEVVDVFVDLEGIDVEDRWYRVRHGQHLGSCVYDLKHNSYVSEDYALDQTPSLVQECVYT